MVRIETDDVLGEGVAKQDVCQIAIAFQIFDKAKPEREREKTLAIRSSLNNRKGLPVNDESGSKTIGVAVKLVSDVGLVVIVFAE